MNAWHAAFVGIALVLTTAHPTWAETPQKTPSPSRSLEDLVALFPSPEQLPGMVLAEEGTLSASEVAAGFPDPADAAQVLDTWGWSANAYRVYVADPSFLTLEISLHQFSANSMVGCANCGASYALSYFAHGRAVMLDERQILAPGMRPCEAATVGEGGEGGVEVTRYLRYGNLLIRVTATLPKGVQYTYDIPLAAATAVEDAVMENAGGSVRELDQTCQ